MDGIDGMEGSEGIEGSVGIEEAPNDVDSAGGTEFDASAFDKSTALFGICGEFVPASGDLAKTEFKASGEGAFMLKMSFKSMLPPEVSSLPP